MRKGNDYFNTQSNAFYLYENEYQKSIYQYVASIMTHHTQTNFAF